MNIRVFLADAHNVVREGLACMFSHVPDITIVGSVGDGRTLVSRVSNRRPDLVLCAVAMPQMNGVDATRQIVAFDPSIKVIALSRQSDPQSVGRMIRAGASGYVHKGETFAQLSDAIRSVMKGESYLSPAIAGGLVGDYLARVAKSDEVEPEYLTTREREVLQLVAEGCRVKDIAELLRVSVKTIETRRKELMTKLGVDSIAELTKYAVRAGLTSLED
jgi:DNA-binding NarL/FixJ family response regulator